MRFDTAARAAKCGVGVLLLAGCGISVHLSVADRSGTRPGTAAPSATQASATTYYGQDAGAVAAMIHGCRNVTPVQVKQGAASGLSSVASCTLGGRVLDVFSWASESDRDGVRPVLEADRVEAYFAQGDGWTVLCHDPTVQMQLTNDAAGLLNQSLHGKPSQGAGDMSGQKNVAAIVVLALGGEVVHVQP